MSRGEGRKANTVTVFANFGVSGPPLQEQFQWSHSEAWECMGDTRVQAGGHFQSSRNLGHEKEEGREGHRESGPQHCSRFCCGFKDRRVSEEGSAHSQHYNQLPKNVSVVTHTDRLRECPGSRGQSHDHSTRTSGLPIAVTAKDISGPADQGTAVCC